MVQKIPLILKTGEEGTIYFKKQDDQNSSYDITFSGLFGRLKKN